MGINCRLFVSASRVASCMRGILLIIMSVVCKCVKHLSSCTVFLMLSCLMLK